MPMQMWLARPREFEQIDQAINTACCQGEIEKLQSWADALGQVVTGAAASGIGTATGAFPGPGQAHFYGHWVGDFNASPNVPPDYWPYAWGNWTPASGSDDRLRIDRLVSAGLQWSIKKVIAAHEKESPDESDRPACSECRTHVTVWVCHELSETEKLLATADLDFRKSLFRVGVVESRDAVVLVIKTPRPIELTANVCDHTKLDSGEGEPESIFKEPVIVTRGFTAGETPTWTQPVTGALTVRGRGAVGEVERQPLPGGGFMPAGTYPEEVGLDLCVFVPLPRAHRELSGATPSDLIKAILNKAVVEEGLDLSPNIIERLRFSIDD